MDEHYRLQFFDTRATCLAINWANAYENGKFATGDCVVRAIRATTNVDEHNRARMQRQTYTDPLTLDAARRYIAEHTVMLGTQIHDCVGIVLEDAEDRIVPFDPPIPVRN